LRPSFRWWRDPQQHLFFRGQRAALGRPAVAHRDPGQWLRPRRRDVPVGGNRASPRRADGPRHPRRLLPGNFRRIRLAVTPTPASPGRAVRLFCRGATIATAWYGLLAAGLAAQSAGPVPAVPGSSQRARAVVRQATPTQAPAPVGTIRGTITTGPDSTIVSLLTIGPGAQLFDRFGHSS